MTKSKAKQWLRAVYELSAYYRKEHNKCKDRCNLCTVADGDCADCLWVIFDKKKTGKKYYWPCNTFSHQYFNRGAVYLRWDRTANWVKSSLKRLSRWEKRLIEICEKEKP